MLGDLGDHSQKILVMRNEHTKRARCIIELLLIRSTQQPDLGRGGYNNTPQTQSASYGV